MIKSYAIWFSRECQKLDRTLASCGNSVLGNVCSHYFYGGPLDRAKSRSYLEVEGGGDPSPTDPPKSFDQVGHQTTNASIGNKHFFTK